MVKNGSLWLGNVRNIDESPSRYDTTLRIDMKLRKGMGTLQKGSFHTNTRSSCSWTDPIGWGYKSFFLGQSVPLDQKICGLDLGIAVGCANLRLLHLRAWRANVNTKCA